MTKLFDKSGMMAYPNKIGKNFPCQHEELLVVESCFCPNGHNLIDKSSNFNGFPGILLKIKNHGKSGTVALSPIHRDNSRIVLGVEVNSGEIVDFFCPHCNVELPIYTDCSCGAHVFCLFLQHDTNYTNCIGICSRVGCFNARIIEDMQHIGQRGSKIQQGR